MAKHFELRICRAITATLQSCRSSNPSHLPENPLRKSHTTASRPTTSRCRRHPTACYAGGGRHLEFKWLKEVEGHVVYDEQPMHRRKICSSPEAEDGPPADQWGGRGRKKKKMPKRKKVKKHNIPNRVHASTSSADRTWFSSGGEEETENLVSSFSTDSSFRTDRRNRKRRIPKHARSGIPRPAASEADIPARLSAFKRLIPCSAGGKMKESFAVVKRSADPYEDFKNSMLDMILEKHMFDPRDLVQLLECFLSLNSRRYHWVIVQAFSEIWQAISSPVSGEFLVQDGRRWSKSTFRVA